MDAPHKILLAISLCFTGLPWTVSPAQASGVVWSDTPKPGYDYEYGIGYYTVIPNHPGQAANITYIDHDAFGAHLDHEVGFFLIGPTPSSDASAVEWSDVYKPGYTYEESIGFYTILSAQQVRAREKRANP